MDRLGRSPEQIGAAIREARTRSGLSQAELGRRAGLRQSTISQIETGHGPAKLDTIFAVLTALELELVVRPA